MSLFLLIRVKALTLFGLALKRALRARPPRAIASPLARWYIAVSTRALVEGEAYLAREGVDD